MHGVDMPIVLPLIGVAVEAWELGAVLLAGGAIFTYQNSSKKGHISPFSSSEGEVLSPPAPPGITALPEKKKGPAPDPGAKPKYPIPYLPFSSEDEQKTCEKTRREAYDKARAGSASTGAFAALGEPDKKLILSHLCETEAGKQVAPSVVRELASSVGINLAQVKAPRDVSPQEMDSLWARTMLPTLQSLESLKKGK